MIIGNSGKIMASINNLVIALAQHANFQNAAHLSDAFALLPPPIFLALEKSCAGVPVSLCT